MLKTHVTGRPEGIPSQESKALRGTKAGASGVPQLVLVEKPTTSGSTLQSSLLKSPTGKQLQSSTVTLPVFNWQRFNQIAAELPPLFLQHYREIALNQETEPLAPDWDQYYRLDIEGLLRILTVRVGGNLVGYLFLLLSTHLDRKTTLYAQAEKFWLDPVFRQGWTGVKLFKEAVRASKEWGATELGVPVEHHFMDGRLAHLLQRLGFRPVETIHSRKLT